MKTITYSESMAIEHLIWMAHRKSEEVDEIIGNLREITREKDECGAATGMGQ